MAFERIGIILEQETVEINVIVIHTNIPPLYSGPGCTRSWGYLFGHCSNAWALCQVLCELCHVNIIPLLSSALLTSSPSQKQRLLLYSPILKSVAWREMKPSSKTSIPTHLWFQFFQDSILQNADFPILINRDTNPAECNVLLDAYFCVRLCIYIYILCIFTR